MLARRRNEMEIVGIFLKAPIRDSHKNTEFIHCAFQDIACTPIQIILHFIYENLFYSAISLWTSKSRRFPIKIH